MKLLPKAVFAGRMLRLRVEGGLEGALTRIPASRIAEGVKTLDGSKWRYFWLSFERALTAGDLPHTDGDYRYPYLFRESDDRYILVSTDSSNVELLLEHAGVAGFVDSPRIHVDRAVRDLVFPPKAPDGTFVGRRYTLGAVYGAVEGYARALRNISFFGDDIADAALFRDALEKISVTRLTLRDPKKDKELLSFNASGGVDFHYAGSVHLNAVDSLTAFFRFNGYIEWRDGRKWLSQ